MISPSLISINYDNFHHIPTVKHRETIASICEKLPTIGEIKQISIFLITADNKMALLSNNPLEAILGENYQYPLINIKALSSEYADNGYLLMNEQTYIDKTHHQHFIEMLRKTFCLHPTLALIRHSLDCSLVCFLLHENAIADKQAFYDNYINNIEQFILEFLENTLTIYAEQLPLLKSTPFYQDKNSRKKMITNRLSLHEQDLFACEIDTLNWTARGKTAEEIAIILNLSTNTITTYRQRAIKKLNAKNISHAIYIAAQKGLI